ncbi:MAG: hypothetical protein IPG61_16235 [bacterium]|nr:hypothetical protein [bacterium]
MAICTRRNTTRELRMRCPAVLLALLSLAAAGATAASQPAFPAGAHADTLFGIVVPDPYRRLEDAEDPAVASWLALQEAHTRTTLAAIPRREELAARLAMLRTMGSGIRQSIDTPAGLILVREGAQGVSITIRNEAADGSDTAERMIFDTSPHESKEAADIVACAPTDDGLHIAVGLTRVGDADPEILVVETASGRLLPDRIGDILLASGGSIRIAWHPDGSGFFHARTVPGAPASERFFRGRIHFHRLGTEAEADEAVFGFGLSATVPMAPADTPSRVITSSGSRWLVGYVWEAASFGVSMYATPLDSLRGATTPWRRIATPADKLDRLVLVGDAAYALSANLAPRGRLVRLDLTDPAGTWETILAEGSGVLVDLRAAKDALYLSERIGGSMLLQRLPHGDRVATPVDLPVTGTLALSARPDVPGVRVTVESWLLPPRSFRYDPATRSVRSAGIEPPLAADFADIVAERTIAITGDGAAIPVSIVRSLRTPLDGGAPLLLEGYGAAGVAVDPVFQPELLAWVEHGGIYAFAHVRGGGDWAAPGTRPRGASAGRSPRRISLRRPNTLSRSDTPGAEASR